MEDTPELATLFSTPPWDVLVVPTFDDGTQRDYFKQMDRQSTHVARSIPAARAAGITHLLHVDDDELLYCPHGAARLHAEIAAAAPDRPDLHLCNVEALLPSSSCRSPFLEATVFRHLPTRYVSYTNGKSIGRLDAPSLRAHGPHHFRTDLAAGGKDSVVTHMISPPVGVVLHYESATYAKWQVRPPTHGRSFHDATRSRDPLTKRHCRPSVAGQVSGPRQAPWDGSRRARTSPVRLLS